MEVEQSNSELVSTVPFPEDHVARADVTSEGLGSLVWYPAFATALLQRDGWWTLLALGAFVLMLLVRRDASKVLVRTSPVLLKRIFVAQALLLPTAFIVLGLFMVGDVVEQVLLPLLCTVAICSAYSSIREYDTSRSETTVTEVMAGPSSQ